MAVAKKTSSISTGDAIKKNLGIILVGIMFFMFWFSGGKEALQRKRGVTISDTTTTTQQIPQPIIIMPAYTPTQAGSTVVPITIPAQYTPSTDNAELVKQYESLVKEYLSQRRYQDSIQLKDTAGNRVGVVNLDQVVSENKLKSTQPSYQLSFPLTTRTITNTVYPPPRTQVSLGVGLHSFLNNPLPNQVEVTALIKNKQNVTIGFGPTYDFRIKEPGLKVSLHKVLSFKSIVPRI